MTTKLATIVAIDVAGFSSLAEANEDAAIAAVGRLDERAKKCAQKHGGRVFNTAADSVMMEFASVARGLEAAAELAANPDPPIRVGLHLGEVSELANGDLLGQGVTIAAHLQSLAAPGAVIVSEDARRALRGGLADRLIEKGATKLDKIDESLAIYELTAQASDASAPPTAAETKARRARFIVFGIVGAIAAGIALFLAWPVLNRAPPPRVAVFTLDAPERDEALHGLATGVADDIAASLSATGVEVVARDENTAATPEQRLARARALGAAFALDGGVTREGRMARITLSLASTDDRTALWSETYEGRADELAALRERAAMQATDVLNCAARTVQNGNKPPAADNFSLLLRACSRMREPDIDLATHDMLAQVVEREPRAPFAHALLAVSSAAASQNAAEPMRERLRAEARDHAERARRADPDIGESYLALEQLESRTTWGAREALLRQGLARNERNPMLNFNYADLLVEVGRTQDALAHARRAAELAPLSRTNQYLVASVLLSRGDDAGAREIMDRLANAPNDQALWESRLQIAFWSGQYEQALALLEAPASNATLGSRRCWRDATAALRDPGGRSAAAQRVMACAERGDISGAQTLLLVSALGDQDHAFELARARFVDGRRGGLDALFMPATRGMRTDARFMPLMKDLGLLRYWNLNDRWPDFCADPGLPYDCRAEAARLR